MFPLKRYDSRKASVGASTMPALPRNSRSAGLKRNRSTASSSRPVPATTPYRRPCGRCLANTSKMALRLAAPLRSEACTMVSS